MDKYRQNSTITNFGESHIPSPDRIFSQLRKILDNPEFDGTTAQRAFLKFVVQKAVEGKSNEIKAYTVATKVFGRREDFNQNIDPIVSIQANKLRRALERYYLTEGKSDSIFIEIPKGTYVPIFNERIRGIPDIPVWDNGSKQKQFGGQWPSLMIRPFSNQTGEKEKDFWGVGLATELSIELDRYPDIRVLMNPEKRQRLISGPIPRFILDGCIREVRAGIRINVQLMDTNTEMQIWGDTYQGVNEPEQLMDFQEKVAISIAVKIASDHGIISRTLSLESANKPPSKLTTYEAILRFYEFEQSLDLASFSRALDALEHALTNEPECGQVWSLLGRIYGNGYSLGFPGFETSLEKAVKYARHGKQLNPHRQRAKGLLALVLMFSDEITNALAEVEKAIALNPNSFYCLEGLGYLLALLGEWERGTALMRRAIQANPFYGSVVHCALWANCFRQQDYEEALMETLSFGRPKNFWEPLMKAATLGKLGRIEKGKQAVEDLLKLKPDFPVCGRRLIRHYIKFDDILHNIIDGLNQVGLRID